MMLFSTVLLFSVKQQVQLCEHLKMQESCQAVRGSQKLNLVHSREKKKKNNSKIIIIIKRYFKLLQKLACTIIIKTASYAQT